MSFLAEEDSWLYTHARFRPTVEASLSDRLVLSSSFSITAREHSEQILFGPIARSTKRVFCLQGTGMKTPCSKWNVSSWIFMAKEPTYGSDDKRYFGVQACFGTPPIPFASCLPSRLGRTEAVWTPPE